jgi:hypothetical protein
VIKVIQGGVASEFLSVAVGIQPGVPSERGLLGLAFDPGYADATSAGYRRFFVNYTEPTTLHTVIASYRTSDNPSVALPGSRVEVLRIDELSESQYHKGGWLGFKPGDANHLYVNVGDGTQGAKAQSIDSLLGKVLRIDVNGDAFPADNVNYAIPADNPFVGVSGAREEVFALGLRNPWRSGFDSLSGDLWIGDVGLNTREELNFIAASSPGGQNFGWSHREGTVQGPAGAAPPGSAFVEPVVDYSHAPNVSNSVIAGYVVHGGIGELDGQLVFGDWRFGGQVWSMPTDAQSMLEATDLTALINSGQGGPLGQIASFGEGAAGELFIVDLRAGKVVQVIPEPATVSMLAAGLLLLTLRARRRLRVAS